MRRKFPILSMLVCAFIVLLNLDYAIEGSIPHVFVIGFATGAFASLIIPPTMDWLHGF